MTALPAQLVIGLGSPHGDDRAGWEVARALAELNLPGCDVRLANSGAAVLDLLTGAERLVICDAVRGMGPGGTVARWNWPLPQAAPWQAAGSHDLGLREALTLAERLGTLPGEVVIWGVEAVSIGPAERLSEIVRAALPGLVARIEAELREHPCHA
ncbi:MAG: hydrogenase maturation protease [Pirellulales bacterium]|nr:hydrogenase maturation protease [Pirellulales bacterium]